MKRVLLHICCGVCAVGAVERLREENYEVIGYLYNPNIHPRHEYDKRLGVAKIVAENLNFNIIKDVYDKENWFGKIRGLESEPEGGRRCDICFKMRLEKTWQYFQRKKFDVFATTLTMSPHKNTEKINKIGKNIAGKDFLSIDFNKKNGFKKAIDISKKLALYRQNYCGCIFSQRIEDRKQKTDNKTRKKNYHEPAQIRFTKEGFPTGQTGGASRKDR